MIGDRDLDRTYPDLYRSVIEVETPTATYRRDVTYPKGAPQRPLASAELREKFATLTQDVVTPERRDAITEVVDRLEELDDIGTLTRLLRRDA